MQLMHKYILAAVICLAIIPAGIQAFDFFSSGQETGLEKEKATACKEHGLKPGQCPFCDPGLIETQGFCRGHGVPEALCHRCRPGLDAAFKKMGDWCGGHNLPESQCEICNPGVLDKYAAFASQAGSSGQCGSGLPADDSDSFFDDFDASGDAATFPRFKRKPSMGCTTQDMRVSFPDAHIPVQAGIQITPAISLSLSPELHCDVITDYDRSQYARISALAPGILIQVSTDLGKVVKKGDVLAIVDSEEFGAAKAFFLEADIRAEQLALDYERVSRLFDKQIVSHKKMQESKARAEESRVKHAAARQRLKNLGLNEKRILQIKKEKDTSSLMPIVSPIDGVVVRRNGVSGELVSVSAPLFDIAAVDKMWALLNVYESDLSKVALGQKVMITLSGLEADPVEGTVSWISTEIDPVSRSLRVRAGVDNSGRRIKSGMFGSGRIFLENNFQVTGIPVESVQWDGCCNLVFVKINDLVYAPRKVKIGFRKGDYYAVESGISPGEQVVTQGSFLLKTEILKSNIGAGCCPES